MPQDLFIEQPQKEFKHMAELQRARAKSRQQENNLRGDDNENNNIDSEDFKEAKLTPPATPSFPLMLFSLAILKDALDLAQLTVVGIIISWIVTILFVIITWLWCLGKVGFIKKLIIRRLVLVAALALVPVLGLLPEASFFILWMHYRETRYVGNILQALEKLEGSK